MTTATPVLQRHPAQGPAPSRGVMLFLHGGAQSSDRVVTPRNLSWQRMEHLRRALAPALETDGWETWLLQYRVKGWNHESPVADGRWALDEVRRIVGQVPVLLIGHSMGARVASRIVDDPDVLGMVGLAPWLPHDDPVAHLADARMVAVHGTRDKITSPKATQRYLQRASAAGATASYVPLEGLGHYMLRSRRAWHAAALAGVRSVTSDH